ncbi:MAG TPA: hypothetical protein DDX47_02665, partial [Candidatus Jacksonbacteria bacterium]|nr:hypothetical protein [Candidatus Jacksonbacteria bacterium]HCC50379.1 hypothetical protein [Candidatus Jacksonbacteria bacterium]HCR15832.1 hypothetical protein [Candidatus Jacksonbacteria bacterium]
MNPRSALQQFGLTDKEARVYLATLELGSASVAKIADKAGLPRPTCYDILASLIRQGIAASFRKKQIRYFSVDDPKRVITIAEERVKSLQEVLPQLEAVYGLARERPTVRFYQGKPGMKQIFEEILADRAEVLAFSSADDLLNCLGEYWTKFVQRRIKLKIPVRTILRDTPQARERQRLGQTELRVVKLIPPH